MDNNALQMAMLFDFFGDLLTEKQRNYFDLYHNEDLSLAEIAEIANISRQGVYDIISRAEHILTELESKTGIVHRWNETQAELGSAHALALKLQEQSDDNQTCKQIASELVIKLNSIRAKH
ncbi:MAG: YlxM family DNA-binding protein [Oscillospiraceae bacterium]|nr:YlxM family DNA-binding protein [Oscillospiraceae bacterium]